MNTVIASTTGDFNGLGFAIPIDQIRDVVDQLIESGKVTRGYLGISIDDLDPQMAATFGFTGKGVLVLQPMAGTPAAKAGIKGGDIITRIDGKTVANTQELRFLVADKRPGTELTLEYFRDGKLNTLTIQVAELPDTRVAAAGAQEEAPAETPDGEGVQLLRKIGLTSVATFTETLAKRLRLGDAEGVLVENVRPGSIAQARGIERGQIITHVVSTQVTTTDDLTAELLKATPGSTVRLRVLRSAGDGTFMVRFILIDVPND